MKNFFGKFTFITDSGEIFGTCSEVLGLAEADVLQQKSDSSQTTAITLIDFELDPHFDKYRNRTRVQLESMNVIVRNRLGQVLSELYFVPSSIMNWKQAAFEKGLIRLDLAGSFVPAISVGICLVWTILLCCEPRLPTPFTLLIRKEQPDHGLGLEEILTAKSLESRVGIKELFEKYGVRLLR